MDGGIDCWCSVFPERPPEVERGSTTRKFGEAWSGRCPATQEQGPQRSRRGTSAERNLAEVREAHQRALATVATLEEKIERLSWSITRGQADACTHFWSHDHSRSIRHCRVWPEESPALPSEYSSPQWDPGSGKDKEARLPFLDFDLELLLELGPEVNHFFQELTGSAGKMTETVPPHNLQGRSMRDGWPGKYRCMIHLTGGQSWQRSLKWMTTGS